MLIDLMPASAQTRAISFHRPDRVGYYKRGMPVACIGLVEDGRYDPGKTVWGWNNCNVPWGNTFVETRDYYIVKGGRWIRAEGGLIPKEAFNAATKGDPIFICTASVYGEFHPGKTAYGWKNCNVPYDYGRGATRLEIKEFWVLGQ